MILLPWKCTWKRGWRILMKAASHKKLMLQLVHFFFDLRILMISSNNLRHLWAHMFQKLYRILADKLIIRFVVLGMCLWFIDDEIRVIGNFQCRLYISWGPGKGWSVASLLEKRPFAQIPTIDEVKRKQFIVNLTNPIIGYDRHCFLRLYDILKFNGANPNTSSSNSPRGISNKLNTQPVLEFRHVRCISLLLVSIGDNPTIPLQSYTF